MGRLQRIFIKPWVFSISLFPVLWVSALIDANPDVFLWEKIRSLRPAARRSTRSAFPTCRRPSASPRSKRLDGWTAQAQANARYMNRVLGESPRHPGAARAAGSHARLLPVLRLRPRGPQRDDLVVRCVRRGIDIETLHVDVPPDMQLFAGVSAERDGARRAAQAIQIPVYFVAHGRPGASRGAVVRDVLAKA